MQKRLKTLLPVGEPPPGLHITYECRRINDGLLEQLAAWSSSVENPRLVILDTLAKVRPPRRRNADIYQGDYEDLSALQPFTMENNLTILVIHHTRKADAEDVYDAISGSTGLTGAADTLMVLQRGRGGAQNVLSVTGRDVDEAELAMELHGVYSGCV